MSTPANSPITVEDAQELTVEDMARITLGELQGDDYDTRNGFICIKPALRIEGTFTSTSNSQIS